jgi:hypothetical protein
MIIYKPKGKNYLFEPIKGKDLYGVEEDFSHSWFFRSPYGLRMRDLSAEDPNRYGFGSAWHPGYLERETGSSSGFTHSGWKAIALGRIGRCNEYEQR